MKLTTEVTERDKKLLVFLAVFVIVIGFGWFLIWPMIQQITDLNLSISTAEAAKRDADYKISRIEDGKKELTAGASQLTADADTFYPMMKSQEIDSMLTLEALSNGFDKSQLRQLTISSPQKYLVLGAYLASAQPSAEDALTGIYGAAVTFVLYGTRPQLEAFSDVLAAYPSIRVSALSWKTEKDGAYLLTLQLQILMTDAVETAETADQLVTSSEPS